MTEAFEGVELISTRRLRKIDGAFPLLAISDFLLESSYTALAAVFPERDDRWVRQEQPGDIKWVLSRSNPAFSECLADAPPWPEFIAEVSGHAFIRDLLELILEPMRESAKSGDILNTGIANAIATCRSADGLMDRIFDDGEIYTDLISMQRGDLNTPHSDGGRKILSLLTYFPTQGWEAGHGGH